ncbi:MAG: beta strand repeat-containing protein [Pyrinomonadaceae bacterium]
MTKAVNLVLVFLAFCFFAQPAIVAQTTELTYQGNLKESGLPANANYDIEFRLFDSLTGGSEVATPYTVSSVTVTDGLFSVKIDFGQSAFPGFDRYLEIAVRRTGVGSYVTLGPRQKVGSSPYSIQSLHSATAAVAFNASNAQSLGGQTASQYVLTGDPRLSDARNPLGGSSNYIQNTSSLQSSSNFNVSGTGAAGIFNALTRYNFAGKHILSGAGLDNIFAGDSSGLLNEGSSNAFFGVRAGQENKAGSFNAFFGAYAGQSNVTGNNNSFFGYFAGSGTTSGNDNSFFGNRAGQVNSSGAFNSFFGTFSGFFNSTGSDNSFFGNETGYNNTIGDRNTFLGSKAGRENASGNDNAFLGSFAGRANTSGSNNSFVGSNAGQANATGVNNSFFGSNAGFLNSGSNNSFFGTEAGRFNTLGSNNTFLGRNAGHSNTTGELNIFIGVNAGSQNTLGNSNTIIGAEANMLNNNLSYATAIGAEAVVTTSNTVVLGRAADQVRIPGNLNVLGTLSAVNLSISASNLTGVVGTANGGTGMSSPGMAGRFLRSDGTNWQSLPFTVADVPAGSTHYINNTTVQQGSTNFNISGNGMLGGTLSANAVNSATQYNIGGSRVLTTLGSGNLFAGISAGASNTTGSSNSFFGNSAGGLNAGGSSNSFFGSNAGGANTSGTGNSFVGAGSGSGNGIGGNNSFFGLNAGQTNSIGTNITIVGANANVGANNLSFATAIGADAVVSTNNTVVLGRNVDTVRTPGNLQVDGTLTASSFIVPATSITGILPVGNGGTGMSLPGAVGNYLRSNGSIWQSSAIAASDIPAGSGNYIQNGLGVQTSSNFNISGTGTVGGLFTANTVNSGSQYNIGGTRVLSNNGSANIFVGAGTATSGNDNTFVGFGAGALNTTGFSNTLLGSGSNVGAGNLTFATAIGAGATVSNNNSVVLGRVADTVRIPGNLVVNGTFTAPTFTLPATSITGTLGTSNGGTGLNSAGTAGNFLRSNGSTWLSQALVAGDIPSGSTHYIQNGIVQQAGVSFNVGGNGTIGGNLSVGGTITGAFNVPASNITGVLGFANGGTGVSSPGVVGNVLRSNGTTWTSAPLMAADIPSLASSYVQNTTTQQVGANFNIGGNGTIGGNLTVTGVFNGSVAASNVSGIVAVTNGGTGLNSAGTSGHFLKSTGAGFTTAALAFGDIPDLSTGYIQNGVVPQSGANFNIAGNGTVGTNLTVGGNLNVGGSLTGAFTIPAANITGILGTANGGTGVNAAGTAGNFLRSNGSIWQSQGLVAGDIPSGSTHYVQNGVAQQAGVNFNIGGNGTIGGNLTVNGTINGAFSVPAANITGVLGTTNGGTGVNAAGTAGNFLRSNGSIWQSQGLVAGDIPSGSTHYVQNGVAQQAGVNFNIGGNGTIGGNLTVNGTINGAFSVPAANITGILGTANGGTGLASSTTTQFLRGDGGGGWTSGSITIGDLPNLSGAFIQNQTTPQAASNFNISGDGTVGGTSTANVVNVLTHYNINGSRVLATTGTSNIFAGTGSGSSNTGSSNSFIGTNAGDTNTTGSSNTIIGADADVSTGTLTNATAIGARASVSQSNSVVIGGVTGVNGGADVSVGIGTTAPKAKLEVAGGNILVTNAGGGVILKSPDGLTCRLLSIDNAGAMVLAITPCP